MSILHDVSELFEAAELHEHETHGDHIEALALK